MLGLGACWELAGSGPGPGLGFCGLAPGEAVEALGLGAGPGAATVVICVGSLKDCGCVLILLRLLL